jgi:hypothetical protein
VKVQPAVGGALQATQHTDAATEGLPNEVFQEAVQEADISAI